MNARPQPYRIDYTCPRNWLVFAVHALRFARDIGNAVDNPVEAAYTFLTDTPDCDARTLRVYRSCRAEVMMALDLNQDARLALCRAWDAVLNREVKR